MGSAPLARRKREPCREKLARGFGQDLPMESLTPLIARNLDFGKVRAFFFGKDGES
jgi:hypothetical protein